MWEKFEELRIKRGVSAYQVCKAIGEPTGMISNWKAGRYQPKSDKIQKIADSCCVSCCGGLQKPQQIPQTRCSRRTQKKPQFNEFSSKNCGFL